MKCGEIKQLLNLFLDGQLNREKSLEVKAHLDKCEACAKEAFFLKESWDLLNEYKPAVPSAGFRADFWKRLAEEKVCLEKEKIFAFPWQLKRLIPVFTAAAVILICGSVYLGNYFSEKSIQKLAMAIDDKDIVMLKNLDLTEDLDVIKNIPILEELSDIESVEL